MKIIRLGNAQNKHLKRIGEVDMCAINLNSIFCSVQRALLQNITPNLRAVSVLVISERSFETTFYYDKQPSEDEEELASLTDTYIICDFSSPYYKTEFNVEVISYPNAIPQATFFVYHRYEE